MKIIVTITLAFLLWIHFAPQVDEYFYWNGKVGEKCYEGGRPWDSPGTRGVIYSVDLTALNVRTIPTCE